MKQIFILLFFSMIYADVTNDSLAVLIEKGNEEILNEVKYIDPLEGKIGGIEINPLYTMFYSQDGFSFSGTISFFPKNMNAEIAFPIAVFNENMMQEMKASLRLDVQYRYFLGKHRKGIHIISGLRHASFKDHFVYENSTRLGIAFGVGYRIFAANGLYWGTSFYAGKYYSSEDDENDEDGRFMNLEFFKFGITF